jgi:hypothetical protein
MNENPKSTTQRRWTFILIASFMLFLWLPTADSIFHIDWTKPRGENRNLAVFPKLPAKPQAYVQGLEAYFNDHFGLRKCLVQWHNKLRWSLFKEKNTRNVLTGKDGWLFYTVGQMIDHYSGQLLFTPEELRDWQVLLETRRDWLAKRGIAYLFVVTPDKHTIYSEFLPDWVVKVRPQTKLDQFMAYMKEHSTVTVLDLRDVVREGKKSYPTYLKTDTHWNFFGGFLAYQELMRALAKERPELGAPLSLTNFTLVHAPAPGGDLARAIGVSMAEENSILFTAKPELPVFTTKMPDPEHIKDPRYTYNPQAKGRIIIFQDSFGMSWVPFLGYHFNQVTYLWYYFIDSRKIESEKPDIVVNEMNERFFNIEDPKKLLAREALK